MLSTTQQPQTTHHIRTFFAGLAGTLAVALVLVSIMIVWLNRTLTDTPTYVNAVSPLITQPAVQTFVADKVSRQILQSAPAQDMAMALLPSGSFSASETDEQLQAQLLPIIKADVLNVLRSPGFADLWRNTNTSIHSSLVSQLGGSASDQLTLDMTPAIAGVMDLLKTTLLSPVVEHADIKPGSGVVTLKDSKIVQFHQYYTWFQRGTVAVVALALLLAVLSVWLSVHHMKTARRVLVGVGVLALIMAGVLWLPAVVTVPNADTATLDAARSIEQGLLHNLFVASLVVATACIALAIASKAYEFIRRSR